MPKAKVSTSFAADICAAMNKGARASVASCGSEQTVADIRGFISTGCVPLDYFLTPSTGRGQFRGGVPIGRVVEIFGPESSGKTTLATQILVSAQRGEVTLISWEKSADGGFIPKLAAESSQPGLAALVDSEVSYDKLRAQQMGLDVDKLIMPSMTDEDGTQKILSMEQELQWIEDLLRAFIESAPKNAGPLVIVWDSVAASQPAKIMENEFGEATVGARARLVQEAMRKLPPLLAKAGATLICVNQVQDKIGGFSPNKFAVQETIPGGRGIKFRATIRLRTQYKGSIEEGTSRVGIDSWVKVIKSKIGPDRAEFPMPVRFDSGIDSDMSMHLFLGEKLGTKNPVWIERGSVFTKTDEGVEVSAPLRGRGLTVLLDQNKGIRARLRNTVMSLIAD
jgi:recombination protein RecA